MAYDLTGGRRSPANRKVSRETVFRGPVRGWVRNENPGFPSGGSAVLLDNFFPTLEGCRLRRGTIKHATVDDPVVHIATYDSDTSAMFACTADSIYDVTDPADADVAPAAEVSSLTSGDWSSIQFSAGGADYLIMVNGADTGQKYNGSFANMTFTGVDTGDLSHVWAFKNRLFFVELGTLSAWYLPTLAVAGTATELPLGSVFKLGGALLFGTSWSQDAGDGLDDYCLFVTTKGEIAVYQGTDPSDATKWSLVGVYKIGDPLHKNAWFRAGGDVAILTKDGIVPVSVALNSDRAGLAAKAITTPIEGAWRAYIDSRADLTTPFSCVLWPRRSMLVIGLPYLSGTEQRALVCNSVTGAWSSGYTGWDVRHAAVFDDKLYFGTNAGTIIQGEVGGSDDGAPYQGVWIPAFDTMKMVAEKSAMHCRVFMRARYDVSIELFANADYEVSAPTARPTDALDGGTTWDGSATWDSDAVWGSGEEQQRYFSEWQAVAATGQALAAGLSVTSGSDAALDLEAFHLQLVVEVGEVAG